jgi:hypothetical protein
MAIHSYASTFNRFPGLDAGNWSRQLLPYLDQLAVEEQLRIPAQVRRWESLVFIPVYMCPTDTHSESGRGYTPSYRISDGSYRQKCRCCDGMHFGCDPRFIDGTIGNRIQLGPRDVTDGMSHTAMVSEKLIFPVGGQERRSSYAFDHPELWNRMVRSTAIAYDAPSEYERFAEECELRALPLGPVWHHDGRTLFDNSGGEYNHILPPNRNSCERLN